MAKKLMLTALVGVLLLVFAGNAFAYGGRHYGGGRYGGGRFYRSDYYRQDYHNRRVIIAPPQRRAVAVFPSRGLIISPTIIISF